MTDPAAPPPPADPVGLVIALALAAAVSLGLARFSYALLLPPMRAELHWSYAVGGAMNTANAAGYLVGALLVPRWLARADALRVLVAGVFFTAAMLALHALPVSDGMFFLLRLLSGIGSAGAFVAGGLLAARAARQARRPGLLLGLYYGGAGLGIVASTLLVPALGWRTAWAALAAASAACGGLTWAVVRGAAGRLDTAPVPPGSVRARAPWPPMAAALVAYLLFGIGYIGYMTFIVTLLRDEGLADSTIHGFYGLLGVAVIVSSGVWAGVLQRYRGGQPLALLTGLLAFATALPLLSARPAVVGLSCLLFGGTFLSVVASTTAFVRHNLAPAAWPAGIGAFTVMFAAGQIVGPTLTGWLSDGPGGLRRGFVVSAATLALAAVLASRQRALAPAATPG